MEIILGIAVVAFAVYFFTRKKDVAEANAEVNVEAPYKVPEPAETTPIPLVVEAVPAGIEATVAADPAPAKKPRAKKPAAIKAAKPKAPKTPKAK